MKPEAEFIEALNQIEKEKGIDKEVILEAVEASLVTACKKNFGTSQNIKVNIDRESGKIDVFAQKLVIQNAYSGLLVTDMDSQTEKTAAVQAAVDSIMEALETGVTADVYWTDPHYEAKLSLGAASRIAVIKSFMFAEATAKAIAAAHKAEEAQEEPAGDETETEAEAMDEEERPEEKKEELSDAKKLQMARLAVEQNEDENLEISLKDAREINPVYQHGDIVNIVITPRNFGRISAQTAKQVVIQKFREAERSILYNEYKSKEMEIVTGIIQRVEHGNVIVALGKADVTLPPSEQIPGERYNINERIKVYVMEVKESSKGPQISISRSHPDLVKRLFEQEIPEVYDGTVEIKSISREAGSRTKIAVHSRNRDVDPVGACVGTNGQRVNVIVSELYGEKIDIISWSDDTRAFIAASLSPSKVLAVAINREEKAARVVVPDNQLSLAIGKAGQNARLAARLTGFKIDIKSESVSLETGFVAAEDYLDYKSAVSLFGNVDDIIPAMGAPGSDETYRGGTDGENYDDGYDENFDDDYDDDDYDDDDYDDDDDDYDDYDDDDYDDDDYDYDEDDGDEEDYDDEDEDGYDDEPEDQDGGAEE